MFDSHENKLVRNLKLKSDSKDSVFKRSIPNAIFFNNPKILKEVKDQILANYLRDETHFDKLRRLIKSNGKSENYSKTSSYQINKLTSINEIVLKPKAKLKWPLEAGADFEFKWFVKDNDNIYLLISNLILFFQHKEFEVDQISKKISQQDSSTTTYELIYPGKPVLLRGMLKNKQKIPKERICLHKNNHEAHIILDEYHQFKEIMPFVRKRNLYVLGQITSVKIPFTLTAGSVFI